MKATEYIPKEHFNLWYEIFKHSNGRFITNPFEGKDEVYVHYSFDNVEEANQLNASFDSLTKHIVETKRGFWKRIRARFNLFH